MRPPRMPPPLVIAASAWVEARMASAIRSPIAASRVRTVAVRLSSSTAVVPIGWSSARLSNCSYPATTAATSGSGVTVAVSMIAKFRPPGRHAAAVLDLHVDLDVDRGHVMRVIARLDERVAAVIVDEEIVGVPGQHEIDGPAGHDGIALRARDVRDADHEIRALAPQGLGLHLDGRDRRQEFQILRARCDRRSGRRPRR